MAKAKIETYTMKITLPSLESLIDKVKDLTSLVSTVMFKFDKNDVLIYCLNGDKKGRSVHSFKSHIMKIDDVFKVTEDVPKKLRLCISDAKKFAVSLMQGCGLMPQVTREGKKELQEACSLLNSPSLYSQAAVFLLRLCSLLKISTIKKH